MNEEIDVLTELGEFTGMTASLQKCHQKGLWHRAVYAFIVNGNNEVLLQKRSNNKKLWPNKWDISVGGHVESGELGIQALIRECKEELGIEVKKKEIQFIVSTTSVYNHNEYINNHYDECYIIRKNINISQLKLQSEEVSEAKYLKIDDIIQKIDNSYDGLTEKTVSWHIFKKINKYLNEDT